MKKKIIISCVILLLLSLTACVSEAEGKKGNEDVSKGKKLINEYVKLTYGEDAKASDFEACYIDERYDSVVPNFNKIASGFVKATVSVDDNKFDMIYHVNTDEVLTKENIAVVQDSFFSYVNEKQLLNNLINCGMSIYSTEIDDPYISEYIEPDITNYQELVESGKHRISLVYRCINSDFEAITEEQWEELAAPFLNHETEGLVAMIFVNFIDEKGYEAEIDKDFHDYFEYDVETPYYATDKAAQNIKNVVYINQEGDVEVLKGE